MLAQRQATPQGRATQGPVPRGYATQGIGDPKGAVPCGKGWESHDDGDGRQDQSLERAATRGTLAGGTGSAAATDLRSNSPSWKSVMAFSLALTA